MTKYLILLLFKINKHIAKYDVDAIITFESEIFYMNNKFLECLQQFKLYISILIRIYNKFSRVVYIN